jgi:hypothetical protein
MKSYLVISGAMFVLLVLVHLARLVAEGASVISSPTYSLTTLLASLMAVWSWRLFRQLRDGNRDSEGAR